MPDDPEPTMSSAGHDRRYDTIVIGAGISGLACASRLRERLPNARIKVLEARNRIGGRIESVRKNGCRLDTGANWIHGTGTKDNPNPLMDILPQKRYRELKGSVMFRPPPRAGDTSTTSSKVDLKVPGQIMGKLMMGMWGMIEELHEVAHAVPDLEARKKTLLQAVQESKMFSDAFEDLPEEYHTSLRGVPQFVENMEAAPLVPSSAEHDYTRPGVGLSEFAIDDFDGDQVFLQDGYTPIVEELARQLLGDNLLETGVEVESIEYSSSPIQVRTSKVVYEANNVVITLPLGVLKARQHDLFQPSLSQPKRTAIEELGFGTLDKVFLLYSHPWWAEEPYSTYLQTPATDSTKLIQPDSIMGFTTSLPGLAVSPSTSHAPSTGPRLLSFINLDSLTGFPALLLFVSCSNALEIESMSDGEARDLAHSSLASWLAEDLPSPPKPCGVHVTRWAQDEFSRGSYSHVVTGNEGKRLRGEFEEPIRVGQGAVRFAGEHTSREHFATAHGALLSGWREAERIIAEVGNGK